LLEATVIGVDVVDVQMRRLEGRFAGQGRGVEGDAGSAGEGGDRPAAVADQMVARCPCRPVYAARASGRTTGL
jgi:hypothetical protein